MFDSSPAAPGTSAVSNTSDSPELVLTAEQAEQLAAQQAVDEADTAAGYRSVVDDETVDELPASDPNVAASTGDFYHLDQVGELVDDDFGVAAAAAAIDMDDLGDGGED